MKMIISPGGAKLFFRTGLLFIPVLLFSLFPISCAQDSIFYHVSNEPVPKDPLISGSPTNMALIGNDVYVASRRSRTVFCYSYSNSTDIGEWNDIKQPGGFISELASDGINLYALIFPNGEPLDSSEIKIYNPALELWEETPEISLDNYNIQSLYGAGGKIFAGAQHESDYQKYAILYLDPATDSLEIIKEDTSLLSGAVVFRGEIYFATAGAGILKLDGPAGVSGPLSPTAGETINGIIDVMGTLVAVSNDKSIFKFDGVTFSLLDEDVANFTGALCLWSNGGNTDLLLMGIRGRGSSIANGYLEMVLNNGSPTDNIQTPGDDSPTSVLDQAKYSASIGVHPVEGILQVPNEKSEGEPVLFASTSKNGLWSYRGGEWNAEQ